MWRAAVDEGLCGTVAAEGMRAAWAAAVQLGFMQQRVCSPMLRGLIADRQLGNWRLVFYRLTQMGICSCSACGGLVALIWRSMLGWEDRRQVGRLRAKVRFCFVE